MTHQHQSYTSGRTRPRTSPIRSWSPCSNARGTKRTRKLLLDTYAECLQAVQGHRLVEKSEASGASRMYG